MRLVHCITNRFGLWTAGWSYWLPLFLIWSVSITLFYISKLWKVISEYIYTHIHKSRKSLKIHPGYNSLHKYTQIFISSDQRPFFRNEINPSSWQKKEQEKGFILKKKKGRKKNKDFNITFLKNGRRRKREERESVCERKEGRNKRITFFLKGLNKLMYWVRDGGGVIRIKSYSNISNSHVISDSKTHHNNHHNFKFIIIISNIKKIN